MADVNKRLVEVAITTVVDIRTALNKLISGLQDIARELEEDKKPTPAIAPVIVPDPEPDPPSVTPELNGGTPIQFLPSRQHMGYRLSHKERLILADLMEGLPNKVIAKHLDIAEATVKVHVKAVLRKIRVQNRTQAAMWAVANNFTPEIVPVVIDAVPLINATPLDLSHSA
jgi:two-component system, NarL family, nitrate/nitrite response regulator NarL